MKRILHIIPTLDRGGAEKQLCLVAGGLKRRGWDVHVALLTRSGPLAGALEESGVPVVSIDKQWKLDPFAFWRLKRHIGALRPELVHTWLFAANCYGRQAAIAAGVPRIVAGERCVDRWKREYELALDRYYARRTDRIVANSPGIVDFYAARGVPREKFAVIPNGVPPFVPPTVPEGVGRAELLAELKLPPGARLVGAIGRLWPQKRTKDLIWAAELLKVIRPDVFLLIIGDGPYRWRLERYRRQLRIEDHVRMLGERSDVPRILPHLDCLWLASGYEGQSNAILEAMAAGAAVLATDIPGNQHLIVPTETGSPLPVGDRAGFARITNQLLDDPALAARIAASALDRARTEFSVERMLDRHERLYRELLD